MTYTPFDSPDAPPLGDDLAPPAHVPGNPSPDAVVISIALNRVAAALESLAKSSPGGAPAPVQTPGPSPMGAPAAPPGGSSDDTRIKMSKKVFAICAQNNWDIGDVGLRATGRDLGKDSRKWSQADLTTVLDVMKRDWGVG